jgi:hypothetical protein
LDVVSKNFAVTLGTTFSQSFSSFASACHNCLISTRWTLRNNCCRSFQSNGFCW